MDMRMRLGWIPVILLGALLVLGGCGETGTVGEPTAAAIGVPVATVTDEPAPPTRSEEPKATSTPKATATPTATPTPPAPLAATVNGEYIFLADYEEQLYQFQQSLVHTGVDLEGEEGRFHMEQARWDILNQMIDSVLIAQNAEGLGLAVTDDELALQVAADIEAGGGLDAFEDWLASAGWTKDDYQQVVLQSMLTNRAWAAITADVPASAEQVRARHIVLDSEEAAKQVWERLQQGADFESLAREESIDTSTSESGGDLGWFPRGVMAVELEETAFGLKAGEIGEPIRLSDQFHIVQVIERAEDRPLEEVLLLHLQQQRFDAWLEGLRESAVIERFISE